MHTVHMQCDGMRWLDLSYRRLSAARRYIRFHSLGVEEEMCLGAQGGARGGSGRGDGTWELKGVAALELRGWSTWERWVGDPRAWWGKGAWWL